MCGAAIDSPMSAAFTTKTAVWSTAELSPESHQQGGFTFVQEGLTLKI